MMESPAPKEVNVEEVCVKSEYYLGLEGVCIKSEPSLDDACIQDEPSCSDACVKDEPSCSDACVKDEPSSPEAADARGVSEAAAAARLYADHVVKDELVLGPELVEPRRVLCAAPGQTQQKEPRGRPKAYQCGQCSYTTARKASLVSHERKHTDKERFICDHCDYTASDQALLQNHMSKHNRNMKCSQCSYACIQKSDLIIHEMIHTGEKPYKCNQCSYACARKSNLKVHERMHTSDKPYRCGQCSFASVQKGHLTIHERIHAGEKPFKCGQCSYASAQKSDLETHKSLHEKLHECGQCNYSCNQERKLKVHKRDNIPYMCAAAETDRTPADRADSGARHRVDHDHTYGRREPAPGPCATSPGSILCNRLLRLCSLLGRIPDSGHISVASLIHWPAKEGQTQQKEPRGRPEAYQCGQCSYTTPRKASLVSHERKHIDKERFICDHCDYTASDKALLQ